VFEFLSDLRNHWRLEPHFLELEDMRADGGRVRVRAPLGVSRVARTRVVSAEPPSLLRGTAEIGRATRGAVLWELAPAAAGTRVQFTAEVERVSALDRVLLACGGGWWLRRIVAAAVARLPDALAER
jgi:Polyketide cyclase / dehydrase and lipid transport